VELLVESLERVVAERSPAQGEAGVVHEDVDAPERIDRGTYGTACPVLRGEVAVVSHRRTAGARDLVHDLLRGRGIGALSKRSTPASLTTTLAPRSARSNAC